MQEDEMIIEACNEKIIVIELEEGKTEGGIDLPAGAQYDRPKYKVVAIGEGRLNLDGSRCKPCVNVGDYLLVIAAASPFKFLGKDYLITQEGSVGAIIRAKNYDKLVKAAKPKILVPVSQPIDTTPGKPEVVK